MKKIILSLVGVFGLYGMLIGQILDPVSWSHQVIKTGDNTYQVVITGEIESGWSTYSQHLSGDEGPVPTTVTFEKGDYTLVGETDECGGREETYDPIFEMDLIKFHDRIVFIQELEASSPITIMGNVNFMVCDDKRCLPPDYYDYTIDLASATEMDDFTQEKACKGELVGAVNSGDNSGFLNPVQWEIKLEEKGDNQYALVLSATIEDGWHIYSNNTPMDAGPFPTRVKIEEKEGAEVQEKAEEISPKAITKMDKVFGVELTTIHEAAKYVLNFTTQSSDAHLKGYLQYQTCDNSKCLPPAYVDFELIPSKGIARILNGNPEPDNYNMETIGEGTPVYEEFDYTNMDNNCAFVATDVRSSSKVDTSWLWVLIAGFAGGLIALLTPCVFPMIPLTVSFFTKSKRGAFQNALIYGLSIIVIYLALGLIVTGVFGASALNQLSTNAWFNIAFFLLFMIFAISFFGFFEITLPSSWSNSADRAADGGGLLGVFFMAFTLALVSFSCTGPIIGTLLVETATGGGPTILGYIPVGPLIGMFGFSLALALPFALFAAFPSWLNSLPRSGSWMNSVKVVLGFIEVALAFKFLSIADLTMGWKILPYELFIAIWALCVLGMALYFFGILKFPLDSKIKKLSIGRVSMGLISIGLLVYILMGFRYSERGHTFKTPELLSGLAPPAGHSYIYPSDCPLNLNCFHDFEKGKAYAEKVNKPILLDFTGYGCVNCRKMEDQVWSQDGVYKLLKNKFVLISLYVDDRTALVEPYVSTFSEEKIETIGRKWSDFQAIHFSRNSQPFYVLLDSDGNILNQPRVYTPEVEIYKNWLLCGANRYDDNCNGCLSMNK